MSVSLSFAANDLTTDSRVAISGTSLPRRLVVRVDCAAGKEVRKETFLLLSPFSHSLLSISHRIQHCFAERDRLSSSRSYFFAFSASPSAHKLNPPSFIELRSLYLRLTYRSHQGHARGDSGLEWDEREEAVLFLHHGSSSSPPFLF